MCYAYVCDPCELCLVLMQHPVYCVLVGVCCGGIYSEPRGQLRKCNQRGQHTVEHEYIYQLAAIWEFAGRPVEKHNNLFDLPESYVGLPLQHLASGEGAEEPNEKEDHSRQFACHVDCIWSLHDRRGLRIPECE